MTGRDTGRDTGRVATLGAAGSSARRLTERTAIVDAFLECAVGRIKAELDSGWIGPEHSPLGAAAHRAAVARRIARRAGDERVDAAIVAGRELLTLDAIADEFFRPEPVACAVAARLARAVRALARRPARNDNAGGSR